MMEQRNVSLHEGLSALLTAEVEDLLVWEGDDSLDGIGGRVVSGRACEDGAVLAVKEHGVFFPQVKHLLATAQLSPGGWREEKRILLELLF